MKYKARYPEVEMEYSGLDEMKMRRPDGSAVWMPREQVNFHYEPVKENPDRLEPHQWEQLEFDYTIEGPA